MSQCSVPTNLLVDIYSKLKKSEQTEEEEEENDKKPPTHWCFHVDKKQIYISYIASLILFNLDSQQKILFYEVGGLRNNYVDFFLKN